MPVSPLSLLDPETRALLEKYSALPELDTALSIGSGMLGSVPAGLQGMGELMAGHGLDRAAEATRATQEALTYVPRTARGQQHLQNVGTAFEGVGKGINAIPGVVDASHALAMGHGTLPERTEAARGAFRAAPELMELSNQYLGPAATAGLYTAANVLMPGGVEKAGAEAAAKTAAEAAAKSAAEAAASPAPAKQQLVRLALSANTESIPGIKLLRDQAMAGDRRSHVMLQDIAHDSLRHLMGGIPDAEIGVRRSTGLYGGEIEPSLSVDVSFPQDHAPHALAGIAKFADNFNQHQVHVLGDSDMGIGHAYDDGSYVTPAYEIKLKKPLNRTQVQKVVDESGLYGLTFGDDPKNPFLHAYYVGDPHDAAALTGFEDSIHRAHDALGSNVSAVGRAPSRLWVYGHGERAIPYESIAGEIRPATSEFSETARRVAQAHAGNKIEPVPQAAELRPEQDARQSSVARRYDQLPTDDLSRPIVQRAYGELANEVKDQYSRIPLKIEVFDGKGEPYRNSDAMRRDVNDNNHLYIYGTSTDNFGPPGSDWSGHPLLQDSGLTDINGRPMVYNDLLRAVHDYYAHTMTPTQFGPLGEEAAWRNHMAMTKSPLARWALTSETRGQNSWVNFRDSLDRSTPLSQRPFSDQKTALLPIEYALTGDNAVDAPMHEMISQMAPEELRGSLPAGAEMHEQKIQIPAEHAQASSLPDLYTSRYDRPPAKYGTQTVDTLARLFDKRAKEAFRGRDMSKHTDRNVQDVGNVLAAEAEAAIQKAGSARGWYSDTLNKAHDVANEIWDGALDDPKNKTAFNFALAISSNGQLVKANSKFATQQFDAYLKTGKFPVVGTGGASSQMAASFQAYNTLAEQLGEEALHRFLNTEFTAGDLKAAGFNISGEPLSLKVPGAAIFGPKIGGGFFANLQGDFSRLTMDRWLTRTIGRITGQLFKRDPALRSAQRETFRKALQDAGMSVPKTDAVLQSLADKLHANMARGESTVGPDGKVVRGPSYPKSMRTPVNNAAKQLSMSKNAVKDVPDNSADRTYMRAIVEHARQRLAQVDHNVTTSDLQALVWYPEQDLWAKLGYNAKDPGERDYHAAFRAIARERGFTGNGRSAGSAAERAGAGTSGAEAYGRQIEPEQRAAALEAAAPVADMIAAAAPKAKKLPPVEKRISAIRKRFSKNPAVRALADKYGL